MLVFPGFVPKSLAETTRSISKTRKSVNGRVLIQFVPKEKSKLDVDEYDHRRLTLQLEVQIDNQYTSLGTSNSCRYVCTGSKDRIG